MFKVKTPIIKSFIMDSCCLVAIFLSLGLSAAIPAKEYHIEPRIVGGSEATPDQFPYLVTIQKPVNSVDATLCGGTILTATQILTVATCVYGKTAEDIIILAGKYDLSVVEEKQQKLKAEKFLIHPGFKMEGLLNNIALIYSSEEFNFGEFILPVTLPKDDYIPSGEGIIAGWGSISYANYFEYPDRVHYGILAVLDYKTCAAIKIKDVVINESNFCGKSYLNKIGQCSGDEGGPFIQVVNGEPTVVGIISYSQFPCGKASETTTTVFVRVSYYNSWLKDNLIY